MDIKPKRVAVIGGGLVGALNACFFAQRGFIVDIFEQRQDIRTVCEVKGRSINLALSQRGIEALEKVGLADAVLNKSIFMKGRMIHNLDWTWKPIPYGKSSQGINSVSRRYLNEILLTAAENYSDVTIYFEHKLLRCDFETNSMTFKRSDQSLTNHKADLIVGCDGAYSETRRQVMKHIRFDYEQKYIEHGYMELSIPAGPSGEFKLEKNYLHIWPRNEYMMIALPNCDGTYTVTLFMPFRIFESIKTEDDLMEFFINNFPDALPLLEENELKKVFFASNALPLITVKCFPYHIGDQAVIMGDAAHAMVPFYGQGMNCGFEDCLVLDQLLTQFNNDFSKALHEYTEQRYVDAAAICDLALFNYIEMRSSVNKWWFHQRKRLDNFLHWLIPDYWVPLYTMVSFTRTRYSKCIKHRRTQDKIIKFSSWMSLLCIAVCLLLFLYNIKFKSVLG